MIRAIILDLDNTLTDFMKMKGAAIDAALDGMVDAGLPVSREVLREHIWRVYNDRGIEYQQVFDLALMEAVGSIDPRVLAAGIVAYRRTRESTLVTYPHVQYTLLGLLKRSARSAHHPRGTQSGCKRRHGAPSDSQRSSAASSSSSICA